MGRGKSSYRVKGPVIKDLREAQFMSPEELAEKAGVSAATIRRMEDGRTKSAHRPNVRKVAKALGVSVDVLIEFEDPELAWRLKSLAGAT